MMSPTAKQRDEPSIRSDESTSKRPVAPSRASATHPPSALELAVPFVPFVALHAAQAMRYCSVMPKKPWKELKPLPELCPHT